MSRICLLDALLVVTCMLTSAPALAQIYKWVDDRGVTQYSSMPPPGVDAQRLHDAPAPAAPEAEAARERSRKLIEEARRTGAERRRLEGLEDQERATRARDASASAEACGDARQQLALLEGGGPAFRRDETGSRVYLEDHLRDAEIARLRAAVEHLCANVDPQEANRQTGRLEWQRRLGELCVQRLEQLHELERPELRASKADIERARTAVDQACGPGAR